MAISVLTIGLLLMAFCIITTLDDKIHHSMLGGWVSGITLLGDKSFSGVKGFLKAFLEIWERNGQPRTLAEWRMTPTVSTSWRPIVGTGIFADDMCIRTFNITRIFAVLKFNGRIFGMSGIEMGHFSVWFNYDF